MGFGDTGEALADLVGRKKGRGESGEERMWGEYGYRLLNLS